MRNYKASCSESPCVGMNRKICLSLFPHRPLAFHGLTFTDGGWLLMQLQTFTERCFSHGWEEKGMRGIEGDQPRFQRDFSVLAESRHRFPNRRHGLQANSARYLRL